VIKLGELVMILDLHRQGLSVSAIARQAGVDRKTVRTYIAKGLGAAGLQEAPAGAKTRPGGASSTSTSSPTRSASSKTERSLQATRLWKGEARNGSILRTAILTRAGDRVLRRSLDFYAAVGRRLAGVGGVGPAHDEHAIRLQKAVSCIRSGRGSRARIHRKEQRSANVHELAVAPQLQPRRGVVAVICLLWYCCLFVNNIGFQVAKVGSWL
jgi:hypothetical protein